MGPHVSECMYQLSMPVGRWEMRVETESMVAHSKTIVGRHAQMSVRESHGPHGGTSIDDKSSSSKGKQSTVYFFLFSIALRELASLCIDMPRGK